MTGQVKVDSHIVVIAFLRAEDRSIVNRPVIFTVQGVSFSIPLISLAAFSVAVSIVFKDITCEIYEIKHSSQMAPNKYMHLINTEYLTLTEKIFGRIARKSIIYKGTIHTEENGVECINAEEYLKKLI